MRILDSHLHWWPRSVFEHLCKRAGYPKAVRDGKNGYVYTRHEGAAKKNNCTAVWFDLDGAFAQLESFGRGPMDAVGSIGASSIYVSDMPADEGRELSLLWNTETAAAQRRFPGRFWGTAAVPLVDTEIAIEVLDHAVNELGLVGVNLPASVGSDPHIDARRLEPFYDRVEELDVPLFLHPTDGVFADMLNGYGGALYLSLGRVVDVSVAAARLIFSGIMERHPNLTVVMSHTGGALPYQAGRLDKNGKGAKLPLRPSEYLKRMYTDTVSPHAMGIKFAIEFFGVDRVMYGSDYPCWDPSAALRCLDEIGLPAADQEKIMRGNAVRLMKLRELSPV